MLSAKKSLLEKYNVPGPRYTSYPTVPYWETEYFTADAWKDSVRGNYQRQREKGISVYIHLPFCESLCTYCGCNKRITKNHSVEDEYISKVLMEWKKYEALFGEKPLIRELHLGGGTPTFFSPENLDKLLTGILWNSKSNEGEENFSFEGHPNNTTYEHLKTLRKHGFTRVSFGVQDFDLKVQHAINRIQPFARVAKVVQDARDLGYTSINLDLVYGLPHQTQEAVADTIKKVSLLKPERIAFYSYAHVPWVYKYQKSFEAHLPDGEEKRKLYESGKQQLEAIGYYEIGMDHFALPSDSLHVAWKNGTLHRNFMGYTTTDTRMLVGLGASAISFSGNAFAQNKKTVEDYYSDLGDSLAVERGHLSTAEDVIFQQHILNIMCQGYTTLDDINVEDRIIISDRLQELVEDGIVSIRGKEISITEEGWPFVRNVAMCFDKRMWRNKPETQLFSKVV